MKMFAEMTSLSEEKDGCHSLCCRMMKMREFKINVSLHFKTLILGGPYRLGSHKHTEELLKAWEEMGLPKKNVLTEK